MLSDKIANLEPKPTDHLPECIYKPENIDSAKGIRWGGRPCICYELRACEERIKTHEGCADAERIEGYSDGYADGLAAARKAVKALHHQHPLIWPTDVGAMQALDAAIDALREKPLASGGIYAGPPIPLGDGCVIPKSDAIDALKEKP